ncbi:MAG: hypothetical protein GEU96_18960 [Propionibacteriales bacterium]|nr:hypothetical protein [Propionibacteriales bacterium]
MKRTNLMAVGALVVGLSACGGGSQADSSEGLDCRNVDFIVPYSPGGGSDRQVRRMQPHLEKALDVKINVTYMEGGDGAIGWQALTDKKPDGCSVSNVVAPNIMLLSDSDQDVGFKAADFEYIAWTEATANALAVAKDSPYTTIEEFVDAAKQDPGGLTVAGVGEIGALLSAELGTATGMEVSYVPVSGGVGDIIPDLLGGHVDAGIVGAAHVAESNGKIVALGITGSEESPALPDVPTYEERGFEGATLGQSWGVIAPPGTPDDIVTIWNDAVQEAMASEGTQQALQDEGLMPLEQSPDEAVDYMNEMHEALKAARDNVK